MLQRAYVEIGNICNLRCSFCPTLHRTPRQMSVEEFKTVADQLVGITETLFLHVMGEPLCHPHLGEIIRLAGERGFRVCITTNGTLLNRVGHVILEHAEWIHRVSISLHCMEGNGAETTLSTYLKTVLAFAKKSAEAGIYTVFRLWNLDADGRPGANHENAAIEDALKTAYPEPWQKRWSGYRIGTNVFLEYAGIFTWPTESTADAEEDGTCHGLLDQIAILADGTVVPCCLDSEGEIPLGNAFNTPLREILTSPRAEAMRCGFAAGKMTEALCRRCTYARRFRKA